jgi:hypothetical protein
MSDTLFRWAIADGMPSTATFSRASTATFLDYTYPALVPEAVRAMSYSGPSIVVRDARGGDTL